MGLDTVAPQPPPTPGMESVTDAVIEDLQKRREGGLKKYGVELQTGNGRVALVDMYQELIDAVLYLRQHLLETKKTPEALLCLQTAQRSLFLLRSEVKTKWLFTDAMADLDKAIKILKNPS